MFNKVIVRIILAPIAVFLTFVLIVASDGKVQAKSSAMLDDSTPVPPARSTQHEDGVVSAPARETLSTWTEEMMASAKPYPLMKSGSAPRTGLAGSAPTGVRRLSAPNAIGQTAPAPFAAGGSGISLMGYSYPPPFDSYEVFGYSGSKLPFPYKAVGRLFFYQYGVRYVCSAAVTYDDVVWTAGHCIHDGSGTDAGFSYNIVFMPGYRDGKAKFGTWKATAIWFMQNWYDSGDPAYDFAAVVLKPAGKVKVFKKVGGWLGFAANLTRDVHWTILGYPAEYPFNGKRQWVCASSHSSDDAISTPNPVGTGCNFTGGSSGGPWLAGFSKAGGWVNGNTSYGYVGLDQELFSPYFGNDAWGLFCYATGFRPAAC